MEILNSLIKMLLATKQAWLSSRSIKVLFSPDFVAIIFASAQQLSSSRIDRLKNF